MKSSEIPGVAGQVNQKILDELRRLRAALMAAAGKDPSDKPPPGSDIRELPVMKPQRNSQALSTGGRPAAGQPDDIITGWGLNNPQDLHSSGLRPVKCCVVDILTPVREPIAGILCRHSLRLKVPANLPEVCADPENIGRVILHLVRNAARYSRPGSVVTIKVQKNRGKVIVSVIDTGIGIPGPLLDKIFDRTREVKEHRFLFPGKLALCRRTIEAQGGKMWAVSRVGQGSRFSVSLPAYQETLNSKH